MKANIIISHVVNDAATHGFVPAANTLNGMTVLITDHKFDHLQLAATDNRFTPDLILECDVFNPLDIIDTIVNQGLNPQLVFSNSDHLQTSTAIVAEFFHLPAKSWQTCLKAKNKHLTRQHLSVLGLPSITSWLLTTDSALPADLTFPLVAKPKEGVASMDVTRCNNEEELNQYCKQYWQKHANTAILLESYIEGPLITIETLGDGKQLIPIGGFDVSLSQPPHFIETAATWNGPLSQRYQAQCLTQLAAFGIGFGVCHSEFIISNEGPILVEINYRSIGDGREFLLDRLAPYSWFETILKLHQGHPLPEHATINGSAHIHYVVAEQDGIVSEQPESFQRQQNDIQIHYQVLKKAGEKLTLSHSNKDYLARLSLYSPSGQSLSAALEKTLGNVHVSLEKEAVA